MKKLLALLIASSLSAETYFTDCLYMGIDLNLLYLQPSCPNHSKYSLAYEFGLSAFSRESSTALHLNYINYRSHESEKDRHVSYSLDIGHCNYGILINFGSCLKTNLFGGIGLMRIKQKLNKTSSKFRGYGPELGFDFSYGLRDGFQIIGKATGTLFIGRVKNHHKEIVPGLEGKAGLAYTFILGDCICSFIGGYQILYYSNAIENNFFLAGPYATFDVAF